MTKWNRNQLVDYFPIINLIQVSWKLLQSPDPILSREDNNNISQGKIERSQYSQTENYVPYSDKNQRIMWKREKWTVGQKKTGRIVDITVPPLVAKYGIVARVPQLGVHSRGSDGQLCRDYLTISDNYTCMTLLWTVTTVVAETGTF